MDKLTKKGSLFCVTGACLILMLASVLSAQSAPKLLPAFSGAVAVTGTVPPGVQVVSIYDLSYPAKTKLGASTSVDRNGNFIAVVKPPLVAGHRIMAVDNLGNKSNVILVGMPPNGPSVQPKAR